MKNNEQEKSLIEINQNSIFYKIKTFFKKLFQKHIKEDIVVEENFVNLNNDNKKEKFVESLKNIEDEETKLLKLQKQYRLGEIKEDELTQEQVNSLCALYDRQIERLQKSNEVRKQKILNYKRRLQAE